MQAIIKFIRKFFFLLNFIVALYSLFVYQLSYSADIKHWLSGFLMLTVPFTFVVNAFFLIAYLSLKSAKFLVSLIVLIIAYPLMERTFKFASPGKVEISANTLIISSYNVMYCDYFKYLDGKDPGNALGIVQVLDTLSADIKCFQEMYNIKEKGPFSTILKLKKNNPYYTYVHGEGKNPNVSGSIGLATFSKYPIIDKEEFYWKPNNNGILRTDIVKGKDTIRVFNVQLKSMGIRVKKVLTASEDKRAEETKNILGLLKAGFESRGLQVEKLEELIKASPFPVIVCGDLNELPYGYAYGRLIKNLRNAFQEKGRGFGFTYHKVLGFLRIDNIFFNEKKFDIKQFDTYSKYSFSDHYPIKATFEVID